MNYQAKTPCGKYHLLFTEVENNTWEAEHDGYSYRVEPATREQSAKVFINGEEKKNWPGALEYSKMDTCASHAFSEEIEKDINEAYKKMGKGPWGRTW